MEGRLALSEPEGQGEGWKVRSGTKQKLHLGSKVDDYFYKLKTLPPGKLFVLFKKRFPQGNIFYILKNVSSRETFLMKTKNVSPRETFLKNKNASPRETFLENKKCFPQGNICFENVFNMIRVVLA